MLRLRLDRSSGLIKIRSRRTNLTKTTRLWGRVRRGGSSHKMCLTVWNHQRLVRPDTRLVLDGLTLVAIIVCRGASRVGRNIGFGGLCGKLSRELLLDVWVIRRR